MSQQLLSDSTTPSDPELIAAVRAGDSDAYGVLFERHRGAAMNLARQIAGPSEADDLVSEAFIKVMRVLQNGGGPDVAFRAYLLTAVRRLHVDRIRAQSKVTPSDDLEAFDPGVPFVDPAVDKFENAAAAKAFASLPERWQLVLWHLEVEGQKPAEVAPLLGLSANSVSALAYRAREGLRQAYLQEHMADTAAENCRWTTEHLGAYVRKGLSKRDATKVEEHLDECAKCSALYLELADVNSNLAAVIGPVLLGSAAAAYLGGTSAGISATGIAGVLLKLRHVAEAHTGATVAGAAAGVVAVGVSAAVVANVVAGGGPTQPKDTVQLTDKGVVSAPLDPGLGNGDDPNSSNKNDKNDKPNDPKNDKPEQNPPDNNLPAVPPPVTPTTPATPPGDRNPGTDEPGPGTNNPDPGTDNPGPNNPGPDNPGPNNPGPNNPGPDKPDPKPPVAEEPIPNPEDDDPPIENPDDPGVPLVTDPEPEPPKGVDVALAAQGAPLVGNWAYGVRFLTTTADPATALTLHIEGADARGFITVGGGWRCTPPASFGRVNVTCTIDSANPGALTIYYAVPRGGSSMITGTVTAADNEDPNTGNNSVSYSG